MTKMLSSWKEIASFFGKGVRTVQRWEKTLDLPIRRPPGAPSNVVLARTSDLEEWMHRSAGAREAVNQRESQEDSLGLVISELEIEVRKLSGRHPQPVDVAGATRQEPLDRLRVLVDEVRSLHHGEHGGLKRVA